MGKVQGLVGAARLGWGLVASPYTVHGGDEVLWMVCGVELEVNGSDVARMILRNLEAVWGVGSVVGCWVENKLSAYVVVRGIPEREWLSEKGGVQELVDGNPGVMWGPRQPPVIGRAWNRVDAKVEIMTAEAAKGAVVRGLVYCGMKRTVHMAVGGGGASIPRLGPRVSTAETQGAGGRPIGPGMDGRLPARGPPSRTVGMALRRPLVGACFTCRKTGHWKNECPDGDGVDTRGCFTCGSKGHISRDCPRRVRMAMPVIGGSKDKHRVEQGPEERRMGPNERGWVEKTKDIFDYTKEVEETIREMRDAVGPSGARS